MEKEDSKVSEGADSLDDQVSWTTGELQLTEVQQWNQPLVPILSLFKRGQNRTNNCHEQLRCTATCDRTKVMRTNSALNDDHQNSDGNGTETDRGGDPDEADGWSKVTTERKSQQDEDSDQS